MAPRRLRPGERHEPEARARRVSRARALLVLKEVAEALNRASTEGRAAGEALDRMADLLGVETGWVWLRDPASDRFYSAAVRNLPPYLQAPVRMTGRSCWCLELFRKGDLIARNIDVVECSRLAPAVQSPDAAATRGLRCHASVPLYAGERPLGVMNLAMRGWRRLTRHELDLLTTIADQLAVAIERARLVEQATERARADERARLARDVHDTLAQGLTAIALQIESGLTGLPRHDRARTSLTRALEVTRQSLEDARQSIRQLRSSAATDRALPEALALLSRRFTAETGVRVHVDTAGSVAIPLDVETELYHIAGEALANIRKHAATAEATLRLAVERGRVRLTVSDSGRGFRTRTVRRCGFGLLGIEERARAVGGRATIRSAPGRGTTITVTVPIAHT